MPRRTGQILAMVWMIDFSPLCPADDPPARMRTLAKRDVQLVVHDDIFSRGSCKNALRLARLRRSGQ